MGLLDDIIPGSDGGGLIDYLKRNVAGLPSNYQIGDDQSAPPSFADQANALAGISQRPSVPLGASPLVPSNAINSGLFSLPPSQGFPGAPSPAPVAPTAPQAAAASDDDEEDETPPQASPIAVGNNYMMPRIGAASLFAPQAQAQDVTSPPNAQPVQGQGMPGAPAPAPAAPVAAPSSPGGFMTGYQNFKHGGGLIGSIAAGITGQRNDPVGVAQQQQAQVANLTARTLIAKGVDPQTAIAAVQPGNSEMLKQLLPILSPQTYTQETDKDGNVWNVNKLTGQKTVAYQPKDDRFTSVNVKGADGSESPRSFNTKTGEYGKPVEPPKSAASVDPELTGQARLEALRKADPDYARRIESMVNGDIPLPTGVAALKPNADRMIKDVLAVDGATSASDFATRAATRKDYASGVASRVTKSLNTTIEHANRLDAAIDKLNNHTYFPGVTNWIHDKVASNTDPAYQKAKSDFESAKEAFIKELDFTLSGGHSSVSGSAELRDKINRADSPEALHAAIQTDLHLLAARLDSHTKGFNEGTKSQRDPQDFLYPKNRAAFNKLMGSQDTSTGGAVPGVDASAQAPVAAPVKIDGYTITEH